MLYYKAYYTILPNIDNQANLHSWIKVLELSNILSILVLLVNHGYVDMIVGKQLK